MNRLKYFALLLLLLLVLGVPAVIALIAAADAPPKAVLPNPNGHDTLWQASQKLAPLPEDFDTTKDLEALKTCLAANSEAILLLEQACGQEMMIPLDGIDFASQQWIDGISSIRSLLRLIFVQARVAELEQRPADAAELYVRLFGLSDRADDGGLLIHSLNGMAGKGMALTPLMRLADTLPEESRKEIASRLKELGNDRIDIDAVMKRERAAIRKQYGFFRAGILNLTNAVETEHVTQRDQEVDNQFHELIRELSRDGETSEEGSLE
ncbi:MAG: hypothetical protein AAFU85_33495 [Planctomycetota bacterium]